MISKSRDHWIYIPPDVTKKRLRTLQIIRKVTVSITDSHAQISGRHDSSIHPCIMDMVSVERLNEDIDGERLRTVQLWRGNQTNQNYKLGHIHTSQLSSLPPPCPLPVLSAVIVSISPCSIRVMNFLLCTSRILRTTPYPGSLYTLEDPDLSLPYPSSRRQSC